MARILAADFGARAQVAELASRPPHLSFSQIQKLHPRYAYSCPRSWAYDKLLDLDSGAGTFAMRVGSAVDEAATVAILAFASGLNHYDAEGYCVDAAEREAEARDLPEAYIRVARESAGAVATYLGSRGPISGVQVPLSFSVRRASAPPERVVGFADWIAADGVIEDLKYAASAPWAAGVWREDWVAPKRDQQTIYHMARISAGIGGSEDRETVRGALTDGRARLVVVHHNQRRSAPELRTLDLTITRSDMATMAQVVREAADIADADCHAPRPGAPCARCWHADRCRDDMARLCVPTQRLVG